MQNLQIMHPNYYYNIIPIIVGALGLIPKPLNGFYANLDSTAPKQKKLYVKCNLSQPVAQQIYLRVF